MINSGVLEFFLDTHKESPILIQRFINSKYSFYRTMEGTFFQTEKISAWNYGISDLCKTKAIIKDDQHDFIIIPTLRHTKWNQCRERDWNMISPSWHILVHNKFYRHLFVVNSLHHILQGKNTSIQGQQMVVFIVRSKFQF